MRSLPALDKLHTSASVVFLPCVLPCLLPPNNSGILRFHRSLLLTWKTLQLLLTWLIFIIAYQLVIDGQPADILSFAASLVFFSNWLSAHFGFFVFFFCSSTLPLITPALPVPPPCHDCPLKGLPWQRPLPRYSSRTSTWMKRLTTLPWTFPGRRRFWRGWITWQVRVRSEWCLIVKGKRLYLIFKRRQTRDFPAGLTLICLSGFLQVKSSVGSLSAPVLSSD